MDPASSLLVDLLEWVSGGDREYGEVMERWRTTCPRLDVWERAVRAGLVERRFVEGRGLRVSVTDAGRAHLAASGRVPLGSAPARGAS